MEGDDSCKKMKPNINYKHGDVGKNGNKEDKHDDDNVDVDDNSYEDDDINNKTPQSPVSRYF